MEKKKEEKMEEGKGQTQALRLVVVLQPHGQYISRLFCPWDFPGKNTGVG